MSLKNILNNIKSSQIEKIYKEKADVINYEGFPAFKRKGLERLKEILFLGHTGNTFYTEAYYNINEKINDLKNLISELDPEIVKNLIVEARNKGFFRHIPIIALILLRVNYPSKFKEIFNDVILTGQDLYDFLSLNRALGFGFGQAVKKSINEWLKKVDSYYVLKYRKQIKDAIRIARPKIDNYSNKELLTYAFNYKSKNKVEIKNEQIMCAKLFKEHVKNNNIEEALIYAKKGRLPADLIIGMVGKSRDPKLWEIIAENMGLHQFIKYLNKLSTILDYKKMLDLIKRKITLTNLEKAKIFPYSLFNAITYVNNKTLNRNLINIANDYILKYDFSKWNKYSWAICPDISDSMISFLKIAGFFSAILAKGTNSDYLYMWNQECILFEIKNKSINCIYHVLIDSVYGGTNMGAPIEFLINNKINKDFVILLTDNQHWCGNFDNTFMSRWMEYKTKINKDSKAIVIEIAGYGNSQIEEQFAKDYDVYNIYGWSEIVINWIENKLLDNK